MDVRPVSRQQSRAAKRRIAAEELAKQPEVRVFRRKARRQMARELAGLRVTVKGTQ